MDGEWDCCRGSLCNGPEIWEKAEFGHFTKTTYHQQQRDKQFLRRYYENELNQASDSTDVMDADLDSAKGNPKIFDDSPDMWGNHGVMRSALKQNWLAVCLVLFVNIVNFSNT